jgi:hypothetical protein
VAVRGKFGTLRDVIRMEFPYSELDLLMQMNEAFRNAKVRSGHIDAHEVITILELTFAHLDGVDINKIQAYVANHMELMDQPPAASRVMQPAWSRPTCSSAASSSRLRAASVASPRRQRWLAKA